ncbi:putative MFS family arabinose efflux permease [Sphingomonas sp. BE138]|uniref:MFS transporter n=1 Tax=Sphingomonas sp. BE138 TaxID=2817845 RepID=UPI00285A5082|nr:MFS transporter [Sphingomonas sp. BE138]MDR6789993.1 putative MFS family arabinose efflux permease [Sphingomonas sp. BE138]
MGGHASSSPGSRPLTDTAAPPDRPRTLTEWRNGWPVVAAAMLGAGLGPGLYQNLSSLFTPGLEATFGWSRGDIATGAGLAFGAAVFAPLIGRIADRIGVRPVIFVSMLVLGAAYLWLAAMGLHGGRAIWRYQLGVVLLVLTLPGTSSLAYGKLIAARFVRGRGLALALGTSGLAAVTIVAAPLLGAVIAQHGWRGGFVALAAGSVLLALPAILLCLRAAPPPAPVAAAAATGSSAAAARRDRRFWIMVASAWLINAATTGFVTQLVPIGLELGLRPAQAALLLASFAASAIAGRLAVGWLIDRLRPQPVAAAFAIASAAAFVALAFAPGGLAAALVLVFLAGLMNGAENDLLPFFAARLFGLRAYAEIYGTAMPIALSGTALGIIGFGRLHDLTGGYSTALTLGCGALLLAATCFLILPDRARDDEAAPSG